MAHASPFSFERTEIKMNKGHNTYLFLLFK